MSLSSCVRQLEVNATVERVSCLHLNLNCCSIDLTDNVVWMSDDEFLGNSNEKTLIIITRLVTLEVRKLVKKIFTFLLEDFTIQLGGIIN